MIKIFSLSFTLIITFSLSAQNSISDNYNNGLQYDDVVYQEGIKTIRLTPLGDDLGMPIIKLFSSETLQLSFDDLYEEYVNYSYTIIHCNADWQPSGLLPNDYLTSFQDFYITDYEYSINALIPYTHYRLSLPNKDLNFKISGNYILQVFRDDNKEKLVFTRKFMVYEDIVTAGGLVKRATRVEDNMVKQEVDFTINYAGYNIQDPFVTLKVTLLQNQRWDNAITTLQPQFIQNGQLIYNYDDINNFLGLNEFRFFDIKNLRTLSQNVRHIERDSLFTVYLAPDQDRPISRYSVFPDINGQYVVRRLDAENSDTESDYAFVDYMLTYPAPIEDGEVYVFGKFTDWKLLPEYKMQYDFVRNAYRGKFLMKQGYYNYYYALKDKNGHTDIETIEGSHWETENDYQLLIYNRDVGARYDRLVGFSTFSSKDLY